THPDSALAGIRAEVRACAVGRGIEHVTWQQRQRLRIEAENPAVVRIGSGITGIGGINPAARQRQRAALQLLPGLKVNHARDASDPVPRETGLNQGRTEWPLRTVHNIQSMDSVIIIGTLVCERVHVERTGSEVDHWRSRDTDFRRDFDETAKTISEIRI